MSVMTPVLAMFVAVRKTRIRVDFREDLGWRVPTFSDGRSFSA